MQLDSEQLSALTLLASGVAADKVEKLRPGLLNGDARLVFNFLTQPSRTPANEIERSAFDVAQQLKQWYLKQLPVMNGRRASSRQEVDFSEALND